MINQFIFIPAYVKIHTVTSLADIHKIAIDLQEYPKYIWIYFILSQHSRDVIKHFIAWKIKHASSWSTLSPCR